MKKLIIILFTFLTTSIYSQTKEETIQWLNLKLEEFGDNEIMGTYQISLKDDTEYGKYLFFIKKSWNPLLKEHTFYYYSFMPKVISNVYLSKKGRTNNTLDIYIVSNSGSIYVPHDEKFISELSIYMKNGNNDMTKRIQTGLLHLFEIMGNKIEIQKELFEN